MIGAASGDVGEGIEPDGQITNNVLPRNTAPSARGLGSQILNLVTAVRIRLVLLILSEVKYEKGKGVC